MKTNKKKIKDLINRLNLPKDILIPYAFYDKNRTIVFFIEVCSPHFKAKLYVDRKLVKEKDIDTFREAYTFYTTYKQLLLITEMTNKKFYEVIL